jgi:hypothetical protein
MKDKTPRNGKGLTFLDGFMSAFDISGGALISIPDLDAGFKQDREAIKGDWRRVGNDMRRAMNIVAHEQ